MRNVKVHVDTLQTPQKNIVQVTGLYIFSAVVLLLTRIKHQRNHFFLIFTTFLKKINALMISSRLK